MRLPSLSNEQIAKAIVAVAFRNGPLEDIHADGRISQPEMKAIMKHAVDTVDSILARLTDPLTQAYLSYNWATYSMSWDHPSHTEFEDDLRVFIWLMHDMRRNRVLLARKKKEAVRQSPPDN
jgi:hypothetical protein